METTAIINRKSLLIVLVVVVLAAVVQSQNLFRFPFFQDVEGTNLANAWAFANTGELSPYTYVYDEPPVGSMILGLWLTITGGVSSFGFSMNSGRLLMLLYQLAAIALVYGITRKITKSDFAAFIAALVFAFSPLAVGFQRRVLLENQMLVWLLAALYFSLGERRTLLDYLLSACCFGIAALNKFAAIGFAPALLYIIYLQAHPYHRRFSTQLWLTLSSCLISFFPLYAQMKQELFPQGSLLGGDFPHVSLLQSLADRGPQTGAFLNIGSGLSDSFAQWTDLANVTADPVIVYGGLVAALFVFVLAIDNRQLRSLIAMTIGYGLYLVVVGQVFSADIVVLLPFLAMHLGVVIGVLGKLMVGNSRSLLRYAVATVGVGLLLYPFVMFYLSRSPIYTANQVDGQVEATTWIVENVPENAVIVTDNYAFVELREQRPNTQHYWHIDTDPAIKYTILNDDLCSIDYLITTPQVFADIQTYGLDLMRRAFDNSELLMTFPNNGWPVEVRQVRKENCIPELAEMTLPAQG
jgi:hypothetical protein